MTDETQRTGEGEPSLPADWDECGASFFFATTDGRVRWGVSGRGGGGAGRRFTKTITYRRLWWIGPHVGALLVVTGLGAGPL